MKKIIPFLLGIVVLVSCGKNDSEDRTETTVVKKSTAVSSPAMNEKVAIGQAVEFIVESSEAPIDSIVIAVEDEQMSFEGGTFTWTPPTDRTGRYNFKLTVHCGESSETHYPRLIMLSDVTPEQLTYQVVRVYPHDAEAFVQGLFFLGDDLIETTGQKGESAIKKIDLSTGEAIKTVPIGDEYFGEGSTLYNDEIYMVTWTSGTGFVFDTDLNLSRSFQFGFEGWGLTTLGDSILMTQGNGTTGEEKIYFMNPSDFTEIDYLEVYTHEDKVINLNELEMVDGWIYANEWQTDHIHAIDPKTGKVMQTIDLTGLLPEEDQQGAGVLNGIAYHSGTKKLYVTGKNWPKLFQITLMPKTNL